MPLEIFIETRGGNEPPTEFESLGVEKLLELFQTFCLCCVMVYHVRWIVRLRGVCALTLCGYGGLRSATRIDGRAVIGGAWLFILSLSQYVLFRFKLVVVVGKPVKNLYRHVSDRI